MQKINTGRLRTSFQPADTSSPRLTTGTENKSKK
jgi:hypothetical protein